MLNEQKVKPATIQVNRSFHPVSHTPTLNSILPSSCHCHFYPFSFFSSIKESNAGVLSFVSNTVWSGGRNALSGRRHELPQGRQLLELEIIFFILPLYFLSHSPWHDSAYQATSSTTSTFSPFASHRVYHTNQILTF